MAAVPPIAALPGRASLSSSALSTHHRRTRTSAGVIATPQQTHGIRWRRRGGRLATMAQHDESMQKHMFDNLNTFKALEVRAPVKLSRAESVPSWVPDGLMRLIPALRFWGVWRALSMTAACMVTYLCCEKILLPGIDQILVQYGTPGMLIATSMGRNVATYNLMHIGLGAAITVSILLSIVTSNLLPQSIRMYSMWAFTSLFKDKGKAFEESHKEEMLRLMLGAAAIQAGYAALAAQEYAFQQGPLLATVMATVMLGGACAAYKLARIISHYGLGEGFSVIICSAVIGEALTAASTLVAFAKLRVVTLVEVAQVAALWTALIALVAAVVRVEFRVPLRSLRVADRAQAWWTRIDVVSDAKRAELHLPLQAAANAIMVFIFAQAFVKGLPAGLAAIVPSIRPAVEAFLGNAEANAVVMVLTILLLQITAGVSTGVGANKFLTETDTGVRAQVDRVLVWMVQLGRRARMYALERRIARLQEWLGNSTSGGNGNADAETVAMKQAKVQEMMVATAELASEREELGSGGRMIGRQVPPGMWQQVYVLRQAVFANTLGGLMLCVVYGAATLLDAYIRSTMGIDLHSVSFVIVASLVMSTRREIASMVDLVRARDAGEINMAPLRRAGPVMTME